MTDERDVARVAGGGDADLVEADREHALDLVATAIARKTSGESSECLASDALDDLSSAGMRVVIGWLPGERDELPGAAGTAPAEDEGPTLTERARETGQCSQCGQAFAETACGPTHAVAARLWFGGDKQQLAVLALRRERDAAREELAASSRSGRPDPGHDDGGEAGDGELPGLSELIAAEFGHFHTRDQHDETGEWFDCCDSCLDPGWPCSLGVEAERVVRERLAAPAAPAFATAEGADSGWDGVGVSPDGWFGATPDPDPDAVRVAREFAEQREARRDVSSPGSVTDPESEG